MSYACLNKELATAPGQLTVKELIENYDYPQLTPATQLYGLIGDPVEQSIGDLTHNALMQTLEIDAVYVKMHVRAQELKEAILNLKSLSFKGLSVTTPHKETILKYLDFLDPEAQEIGAVNTIILKDAKAFGYNTDGIGALSAIEKYFPVHYKTIVILGAGGAARAIAYEAKKRGARVILLNRNLERAKIVGKSLRCEWRSLEELNVLQCC